MGVFHTKFFFKIRYFFWGGQNYIKNLNFPNVSNDFFLQRKIIQKNSYPLCSRLRKNVVILPLQIPIIYKKITL
jgi:hypothetical protein